MATFVIGIFSLFTGDNKLFTIVADSSSTAAKKALIEHAKPEYRDEAYIEWANIGTTYKEVKVNAANSDLIISDNFIEL